MWDRQLSAGPAIPLYWVNTKRYRLAVATLTTSRRDECSRG
jgi:hypothetical protein